MKKNRNNIIRFPAPPPEDAGNSIFCQFGNERFAIHYQVEDLPPANSPVILKPAARKRTQRRAFHTLAAAWPTSRLVEIWNSIPGFTPVKRFTNRKTATARIWKAIQSLDGGAGEPAASVTSDKAATRKKASPTQKRTKADTSRTRAKVGKTSQRTPKPGVREGSKTAKVLSMLQRSAGASLKELMRVTGWQAHSVRGFISGQLGKKMGLRVKSFERKGERVLIDFRGRQTAPGRRSCLRS